MTGGLLVRIRINGYFTDRYCWRACRGDVLRAARAQAVRAGAPGRAGWRGRPTGAPLPHRHPLQQGDANISITKT